MCVVTADTIEPLLQEATVPEVFDVLSIDIDGNDFWVWQAISSFKPRVRGRVQRESRGCEANCHATRRRAHLDGSDYFGASLGAFRALASEKGYEFVHTDRRHATRFLSGATHTVRCRTWRSSGA